MSIKKTHIKQVSEVDFIDTNKVQNRDSKDVSGSADM